MIVASTIAKKIHKYKHVRKKLYRGTQKQYKQNKRTSNQTTTGIAVAAVTIHTAKVVIIQTTATTTGKIKIAITINRQHGQQRSRVNPFVLNIKMIQTTLTRTNANA